MTARSKALIAIFSAAVLWASAGAVAKLLFRDVSPFVAVFHRFALASIVLLPLFLKQRKPAHFFRALLPLGLFNTGNVLFYYSGVALTTANTAVILGTAVPITTLVLARFLIGEPVSRNKIAGIIIGFVGALCIVFIPLWERGAIIGGSFIGNVFLVGSLISWSLYIVYSRHVLSRGSYDPVVSTFINVGTVAVLSGVAALATGQSLIPQAITRPSYVGLQLFASVGLTVVTFFLFQWGVRHVSASTASLKEYIQLLFGILINAVILHESLTASYLAGGILIIVGVLTATGRHVTRKIAVLWYGRGD